MKYKLLLLHLFLSTFLIWSKSNVKVEVVNQESNRAEYAAKMMQDALKKYNDTKSTTFRFVISADTTIHKEGFRIATKGQTTTIYGHDGNGLIYGSQEIIDRLKDKRSIDFTKPFTDAPEMLMRGTCIGLQKTTYLPGHSVYEYPYTPENFPWFYDKARWIKYLDMLVANRMNSLYLWNGHPFASLVKLKDYPFAVEVDDSTFKKNEDIYSFLTKEADKRGIFVIQMFYNIIVSKPFADHYGIKTQDRHRPITPLISDYTRKSIAAFVEKYPNIGFLITLGEAMDTYQDDVEWFTKTIIPGVKDGMKALGTTKEPPIILRGHDTDAKMDIEAAKPLYKNLYTMNKYTGESLTTYEPGGPWAQTHRDLSSLVNVHIENVHILANLEPWRWGSPWFIQKTVNAMHKVHHANGLHLYPQASYWDYPYAADKLQDDKRLVEIDRDWIWYQAWARYAWKCERNRNDEINYWDGQIGNFYGIGDANAQKIQTAYDESGEIAPKLLRRFGITEGNRQTLLLGMTMSELVNPYKYTIYPGFYESCGPQGEKLIEYVEKEWKHQPHVGELPLDIANQVMIHGDKAVAAIDSVEGKATKNTAEFERLRNDMHCYRNFAYSFAYKVKAAQLILNYQWSKDIKYLDEAVPLMEKSLEYYKNLVDLTKNTYWYANSMQTDQRRIPIGGDDGKNKTWAELYVYYQKEFDNYKKNLDLLKYKINHPSEKETVEFKVAKPAEDVKIYGDTKTAKLANGLSIYPDRDTAVILGFAPELKDLDAFLLSSEKQKHNGTQIEFDAKTPVHLLVGYFRDDQNKFAEAPKLETDAAANEYGQADPLLLNAVKVHGLPAVNIHSYSFYTGHHKLLLPKGMCMILGFTHTDIATRDVGFDSTENTMDWMFY